MPGRQDNQRNRNNNRGGGQQRRRRVRRFDPRSRQWIWLWV